MNLALSSPFSSRASLGVLLLLLTACASASTLPPDLSDGGLDANDDADTNRDASIVDAHVVDALPATDAANDAASFDLGSEDATSADAADMFVTPGAVLVDAAADLMTAEMGSSVTFTVRLDRAPSGEVVVPIESSDDTEISVSPTTLTFTPSNWASPQIVTVTGLDDAVADGPISALAVLGPATSGDPAFEGADGDDVTVVNVDDDAAGIVVTPTDGLSTTESGGTDTFAIVLQSEPTADVVIELRSSDTNAGTVSPTTVTFTASNWSVPQSITVTGASDHVIDNIDIAYEIMTSDAESADAQYQARDVADVSAVNHSTLTQRGYLKAGVVDSGDMLGGSVAVSDDGSTLVVGASWDASNASGVGGSETNNSYTGAGAVHVYVRGVGGAYTRQAYIKASNPYPAVYFGRTVSLSADGNTLAVGSEREASGGRGVEGAQSPYTAYGSGAVFVFTRVAGVWSQQAYIKSSNSDPGDFFWQIDLSADGNSLAVGASRESSNATGIGGDQSNNDATWSGAAYVFTRSGSTWTQDAYIKASNAEANDSFGAAVALSSDGTTLAVAAHTEDSGSAGVGANQADNSANGAGAVYVFRRGPSAWTQESYIKASNPNSTDFFGAILDMSADGNTLIAGAYREGSAATGINGDQANNSALVAGAVYVFARSGVTWSQEAYVKASNTDAADSFGWAISISSDGNTFAVGAPYEDSAGDGIGADASDNSVSESGAIYVFRRRDGAWHQVFYVKASNSDASDQLGASVGLSGDGNTIVSGAPQEDSAATLVDGDETSNATSNAGAAFVFAGG